MNPASRPAFGANAAFGAIAALMLFIAPLAFAQYPRIKTLDPKDVVFRQLMEDLDVAYRDEAAIKSGAIEGRAALSADLHFYSFIMAYDADIFSLAARLNIPYDTLASLNRMSGSGTITAGAEILIPSRPGIFLTEKPASDLEYLMYAWRNGEEGGALLRARRGKRLEQFLYFPAGRFNAAERLYFLNGAYRYPLPKGRLTSGFGMRLSPITGLHSMHSGIDLAAPEGTPVLAARSGTVTAVGYDDTLGNYVILSHDGGHESVYGHLHKISVSLKDGVKSGTILGAVGSTGKSTGPHLHFEIRVRGEARNPESYIPRLPE
jgi:murein DD-endopeptidase MepM/ murein hydrolase activator NlpD